MILNEVQKHGVKDTLTKYGLYQATIYYWKRNYANLGQEGLKHKTKKVNQQIKVLVAENSNLKILLAEKELEIKYPELTLKKSKTRMEKVEMVREMMSKGIKRDESLRQSGLTRNQFY